MKEDSDNCILQRKVFSSLVTGAHPIPLMSNSCALACCHCIQIFPFLSRIMELAPPAHNPKSSRLPTLYSGSLGYSLWSAKTPRRRVNASSLELEYRCASIQKGGHGWDKAQVR